ncbi:hypothetical protein ACP0HM_06770 [Escherichia coli]
MLAQVAKASSTAARQLPPAHGRQVDDDGQGCRKSAVILQVWPPVIFLLNATLTHHSPQQ